MIDHFVFGRRWWLIMHDNILAVTWYVKEVKEAASNWQGKNSESTTSRTLLGYFAFIPSVIAWFIESRMPKKQTNENGMKESKCFSTLVSDERTDRIALCLSKEVWWWTFAFEFPNLTKQMLDWPRRAFTGDGGLLVLAFANNVVEDLAKASI